MAKKDDSLYVVAIGASAGGLEAINDVFENMPGNTNFSFVVLQHLSPDYKSLMSELLAKRTSMAVKEAENNTVLVPNTIYLLPSKMTMRLKGNRLKLEEKPKDHLPNSAIDIFFESLAEEKGDRAVGIILSGTGSDGTKGAKAIKEKNGLVIVQDPLTAAFDGMPNSAITAGVADLVLAAEMIPDEMIDYLQDINQSKKIAALSDKDEQAIAEILDIVHHVTEHNFAEYKKPTINRRLSKRMTEMNIPTTQEYVKYLQSNPEEAKFLCREFLIGVTKFFRDEEVFREIRNHVLPAILNGKKPGSTIKLWVAACSTGEEAYSYAMLIQEFMDQANLFNINVKIFATDIDREALEVASKGIYPQDIEKDVSEARLNQFFIHEGNTYRVAPAIRRMVVFAYHNVLKDPPFSRIELVSCRNLLIYMNPAVQKNVMRAFHFALNLKGFLVLGPSENPGALKDHLQEVNKKWKIYKCVSKAKSSEDFYNGGGSFASYTPFSGVAKQKNAIQHLPELFQDTLLEEYPMAGIFIDKEFEVKQAIGDFKRFLRFPEANFNFNLLKLVSADLSIALGICVRKAIQQNARFSLRRVKVQEGNTVRYVNIVVKPYIEPGQYLQSFLFVVLEEVEHEIISVPESSNHPVMLADERINELQKELKETRDNLQAVIEELESTNEELQSSNEEIISSNEELQSTNEELQSLNEELHTVNAEHQLKIRELIELNEDLNNYFQNTDIGQVFLDNNMVIRKFTPVVKKQINLIHSDIGRSLFDISTKLKGVNIADTITKVLETGKIIENEVMTEDGSIYLMRITPYIKNDKSRDGVVINFINVTEQKKLDSIINGVFNSSTNGIIALKTIRNDKGEVIDFEVLTANDASIKIFQTNSIELIGSKVLQEPLKFEPEDFEKYRDVVKSGDMQQFEYYLKQTGRWYEVTAVKMLDGLVATFNDITQKKSAADIIIRNFRELKEASEKLQETNTMLEQSNMDLMQFASVASHDLKEPLRKVQAFGNILKEKIGLRINTQEKNYLDKMVSAANRMQTLVEDVLTLSKLSNKDVPHVETSLNATVERIIDDLEITIKECGADIRHTDLPVIKAIPGQMHQLFQNLISNSLKFCKGKPPVIEIGQKDIDRETAREYEVDPSRYRWIFVKDNGIGFEPHFKDKIFGVFQRLNTTEFSGTGIGLAICKKIVENHKGYIWPESEPGKGATFNVLLPVQND